ncbi:hypothetical protein [Anatilimnocola floriformis]|uniref:hypothetical protein n=1 Tax=Anatilimnocola floriformis TaxID=2948575 RepID=UPI0020C45131|nr:hypothetical protein [Anatilimnocola floriformis]
MSGSATTKRFVWRPLTNDAGQLELFDTGTSRQVAVITGEGSHYQWTRSTSLLLHGAPPAAGEETTLLRAKIAVLTGIPG